MSFIGTYEAPKHNVIISNHCNCCFPSQDFFLAHLNNFGSLREFLSKVLKLGNNDIVGGVALQWTRVVATYLTKNVADIKM